MRVGIAKPESGIVGGFELLLGELAARLRIAGLHVEWLTIDTRDPLARAAGVPAHVRAMAPGYFDYVDLVDGFRRLDVSSFDVVITTSPPSFAVDHGNRLGLFYHHQRIYYDLADLYVRAGFAEPSVHEVLTTAVRKVDDGYLAGVRHFLAGSRTVADRLVRFNDRTEGVDVFSAPPIHPADASTEPTFTGGPLCVGRLEFPKRTELFVAAMKLVPGEHGSVVGDGGRLGWTINLDADLSSTDPDEIATMTDQQLWLHPHRWIPDAVAAPGSNVTFHRGLSKGQLTAAYRNALCVVAPAYQEDYGLTALEAMTHGVPVIVCEDGGGLVELVEDGVTGLVVPPTASAIAQAVRRLADDRSEARRLGTEGRAKAAEYTWDRAVSQLIRAIEVVAS